MRKLEAGGAAWKDYLGVRGSRVATPLRSAEADRRARARRDPLRVRGLMSGGVRCRADLEDHGLPRGGFGRHRRQYRVAERASWERRRVSTTAASRSRDAVKCPHCPEGIQIDSRKRGRRDATGGPGLHSPARPHHHVRRYPRATTSPAPASSASSARQPQGADAGVHRLGALSTRCPPLPLTWQSG